MVNTLAGYGREYQLPVTQLDIPMTATIIHGARTPILKPSS